MPGTRIAHVLCEFALRLKLAGLGDGSGYQLPMTQEQLGDTTGLTSVHVNRTLKLLEAEGLIERLSPRSITIGDWKKLAEVGDFDSAICTSTKASQRWPDQALAHAYCSSASPAEPARLLPSLRQLG